MIISNGIDIIDIRRIKKTISKYSNRFKERCFSQGEINRSESQIKSAESYAKKYFFNEYTTIHYWEKQYIKFFVR